VTTRVHIVEEPGQIWAKYDRDRRLDELLRELAADGDARVLAYSTYSRTWTLTDPEVADIVAARARALGCTVRHDHPPRAATPPPPPPGSPSRSTGASPWAEQLFAAVGPDRAESVFKALTRVLHPDVGGDTELMKELNAAREKVAA